MSALIEDQTRPMRAGEELDVGKLRAYLETEVGAHGDVAVEQFPGGHSNLTYLVRHGDREYVLRRPPFGSKVKSAHDMGREVAVLSFYYVHERGARIYDGPDEVHKMVVAKRILGKFES